MFAKLRWNTNRSYSFFRRLKRKKRNRKVWKLVDVGEYDRKRERCVKEESICGERERDGL